MKMKNWKREFKLNQSFLKNLRTLFGIKKFNFKEAKVVYTIFHSKDFKNHKEQPNEILEIEGYVREEWLNMNCGNNLTCSVEQNKLIRVNRGIYKFLN